MKPEDIDNLISNGYFPHHSRKRKLIETHISQVILCDEYVYKIKKPLKFSFLDFTTLALRKFYCDKEVELNRRFAPDVYLKTVAISKNNNTYYIENEDYEVVEYAVKMKRLDSEKQMNKLLQKKMVSKRDVDRLAKKIVDFHKDTKVIYQKNVADMYEEFNDIRHQRKIISESCGKKFGEDVNLAIQLSNSFLDIYLPQMQNRLTNGYYRDCHGDLHTRNIFLLPEPIPFDCIEFNDDFREIDVLNEIAFLCMDLEAFRRKDLSKCFFDRYFFYSQLNPTQTDKKIFTYYKAYRANVRAKVLSLKIDESLSVSEFDAIVEDIKRYLNFVISYLQMV